MRGRYQAVLMDLDDTLLDFQQAERLGISDVLRAHGLEPEEGLLQEYHRINQRYWDEFERQLITKDQILGNRFTEFFAGRGLDVNGQEEEAFYRERLNRSAILIDGALEICDYLHSGYELYVVTNGVAETQRRRLAAAGLDRYFQAVFVSEDAGAQKPRKEFFDYCFAHMRNPDPRRTLIIGDSLSADIRGGNDAGIHTCWYNPRGLGRGAEVTVDHEIKSLPELKLFL